ncbi:unnamed protein product [Rangifer tarandus platyrhynchus]|uniref:Secreted protein n=1 Tax=Rangifer tarandus platyrhynchus TaxID=3082113 RepID=A0ABN8ZVY1_RANTA|nr:unnamed protein product [Rangifer tarandus platyrhynchus]
MAAPYVSGSRALVTSLSSLSVPFSSLFVKLYSWTSAWLRHHRFHHAFPGPLQTRSRCLSSVFLKHPVCTRSAEPLHLTCYRDIVLGAGYTVADKTKSFSWQTLCSTGL